MRSFGQEMIFDVWVGGRKTGELILNKVEKDDSTIYTSKTALTINIFGEINVIYDLTSIYKDSLLISSSVKTYKNYRLNSSASVTKSTDGYLIEKDGEEAYTYGKLISYSGVKLFFEEPVDQYLLFSEIDGKEKIIEHTGRHTYRVKSPMASNTSYYTYNESGELEEIIIDHTIIKFKIKRSG